MRKLKLQKSWDEVKEQLKEVNTALTDEDLVYREGEDEALLERLSPILKMSTEEVKGLIESISYNQGKAS